MQTIRIKATGKIKTVDNNVAFDLIDKGEAEVYKKPAVDTRKLDYSTRQVHTKQR